MQGIKLRCVRKAEAEVGNGQVQYEIALVEVQQQQALNPAFQGGQPVQQPIQNAPIQISFVTTDSNVGGAYTRGQEYVLMPAEAAATPAPGSDANQ